MRLKLELVDRFLTISKESFFLFGPRGTGKSTWTQGAFKDALRIDLLSPEVFRSNSARPERLREALGGEPGGTAVIVDEVQMEGLVRNVGNFSRFLEAITFSHAGLLNLSNVARECEVERKAVESYVSILEDLLLAFRLSVFTKRAKRAVAVHPKFYLFDAGVFRSLRPQGPLDRPHEIDGLALEGLVAQHLRAWNAYGGARSQIAFWRTRSGVEVDFVVYGPDGFWAVEVKNAGRVRDEELRGLRAFHSEYPEARLVFLYRGKEKLKRHGILCMPCDEFLRGLVPGRGLPIPK